MKSIIVILFSLCLLGENETIIIIPSAVYRWDNIEVIREKGQESRHFFHGSTTHLVQFKTQATTLYAGEIALSKYSSGTEEELILVLEGQLKIITDNQEKTITKGGVSLIMPDEEYGIESIGGLPATYYIMNFRSKAPMSLDRGLAAGGSLVISRNELDFNEHDKGGRWNYFDRPTASCSDFEMHATRLDAGVNSHPPHTHLQEEIILMLEGNAIMHIDGKEYKTSKGDVIFLDSEVPHGLTNSGSNACEYFAFQWR